MKLARLISRCPAKLGVKEEDKVVFYEHDGRIVIDNAEKLKFDQTEQNDG